MTGQINLSDLEPTFTRTMARQIELSTTVANVEVEVEVRKYEVDTASLIKCLQQNRKGYSIGEIATLLGKPKTLVEHWFRRDKYFAIPDADCWLELKRLLGITTNEFDESIMTFETKAGVFDTGNRIHIGEIAPTLSANGENTLYCLKVGKNDIPKD